MRVLIAIVVSLGITLGLFYVMQSLIASGDSALTDPPKGKVLDFVRLQNEETVETKKRMPRKPPQPEEPPPPMEQPQMAQTNPTTDAAGFDFSAQVDVDVALDGGLALDSGDGEYLPIVKVSPVYPRRALSRGIEGYVIVEFTVTKQGSVRDPIVVEAEPANLFDKAAKDAAKKFKYKPRVVNGEPVEVEGVQNRITFEISG